MTSKIAKRTYTKRDKKEDPLPKTMIATEERKDPARTETKDWRPKVEDTGNTQKIISDELKAIEAKGPLMGANVVTLAARTKLAMLSEEEKKERHREQMKKWREKNPDYNKTYRQKYYQEHKDEILAKRRAKRDMEKKIISDHYNTFGKSLAGQNASVEVK